jgi:hypothetical protein
MADNLDLWNSVAETDPEHTKKINARGGFTAIGANYQIREATRAFGPIGIGWGYTTGQPMFQDGLIIVPVSLWHGSRTNVFGPMLGAAVLAAGGRVDHDAPKKATTDAITKLLSQIGFNADVFLGLFDDVKYVEELKQKKEVEKKLQEEAQPIDSDRAAKLIALLEANRTPFLDALKPYGVDSVKKLTVGQARELFKAEQDKRKAAMAEKEAA